MDVVEEDNSELCRPESSRIHVAAGESKGSRARVIWCSSRPKAAEENTFQNGI